MKIVRYARSWVAPICALAFLASPVWAQEFTFKLHHLLPPKAPAQTKMLEPWVKQVEKNAGGRVKIEIFPAMSLGGKPPELIQQARDGVVDIVWTVNGYTPGVFPRTEVFELPFVFVNDPRATNLAMRDMFESDLKQEYKGVEVMFLHVHAGQAIHMVDKLVRKPSDLAGMKMRIPTRTSCPSRCKSRTRRCGWPGRSRRPLSWQRSGAWASCTSHSPILKRWTRRCKAIAMASPKLSPSARSSTRTSPRLR